MEQSTSQEASSHSAS